MAPMPCLRVLRKFFQKRSQFLPWWHIPTLFMWHDSSELGESWGWGGGTEMCKPYRSRGKEEGSLSRSQGLATTTSKSTWKFQPWAWQMSLSHFHGSWPAPSCFLTQDLSALTISYLLIDNRIDSNSDYLWIGSLWAFVEMSLHRCTILFFSDKQFGIKPKGLLLVYFQEIGV